MYDKIKVRKEELLILKVPVDENEDVTVVSEDKPRKLTLAEWKRIFPKPRFKWNKE